jgi:hypothetical protein
MTTIEQVKACKGRLPAPEYTNPAQAEAVARCRRDGDALYRVVAIEPRRMKAFGYDLPYCDARSMKWELEFNGYKAVEMFKIK